MTRTKSPSASGKVAARSSFDLEKLRLGDDAEWSELTQGGYSTGIVEETIERTASDLCAEDVFRVWERRMRSAIRAEEEPPAGDEDETARRKKKVPFGSRLKRFGWTGVIRQEARRAIGEVIAKEQRRRLILESDPQETETPNLEEQIYRATLLRDADECMSRMSPDHKIVLLLLCKGKTYGQIADELGIPIGTVSSRIRRAKDAMKECLVAKGHEVVEETDA